jgi:large subunit ribosomal protein L15
MNLSDLKPAHGATHRRKRVGRGTGSGHGKTSGQGHKGQRARSSGNVRPGYEGGQMPFSRRVPKFGFTNPFRVEYQPVNVSDLERAAKHAKAGVIDAAALKAAGMIHHVQGPVKILGGGELKAKLTIKADRFSEEAKKKIEAAGGKIELIAHERKPVERHSSKRRKPGAKPAKPAAPKA